MEYRRLGITELNVSILGFGAIKLPDVSYEQAAEALNRALDLGINFVDTARGYGDSENKIGRGIGHRRQEFYIATKTTARDSDGAMADLETSLRELGTDYVDLWQLHTVSTREAWEQVTGPRGALEAAKKALEQGKTRYIGITIHRELHVMREAITCGEFQTIMLAYSPLDQEGVAAEILPLARQYDLGVLIMKPLSGGQLVRPPEQRRAGLGGADAIIAGSLRYVLGNPNVTCAIPGMTSAREVEENVEAVSPFRVLSEEEEAELRRQIAAMGRDFRYGQVCLRCGYCLPCTVGINIPEVMRAMDMKRGYPDELRYLGDELYHSLRVKADACVQCGECESRCVAGLQITAKMREAAQLFGA
ncbi:MAG: aldo/keto reductase [Armatimonadetes bacterium]|nr:aldo/keto reductase [Armatimonadota bacterium]